MAIASVHWENPMDRGAWQAAVRGVVKSQTQLSNFTFHFPALEKEMATHSSVLAWRIPGTGEPGGLPSMGSQSQTRLKRLSSSNSSTIYYPLNTYLWIYFTICSLDHWNNKNLCLSIYFLKRNNLRKVFFLNIMLCVCFLKCLVFL